MLWLRPYTRVNRNGSAAIASTGVKVNTADVVFTFKNHAFVNASYRGTIFVNLRQAIPTGTTGTLPILFETNGATQAVTNLEFWKWKYSPIFVILLSIGTFFDFRRSTLAMVFSISSL